MSAFKQLRESQNSFRERYLTYTTQRLSSNYISMTEQLFGVVQKLTYRVLVIPVSPRCAIRRLIPMCLIENVTLDKIMHCSTWVISCSWACRLSPIDRSDCTSTLLVSSGSSWPLIVSWSSRVNLSFSDINWSACFCTVLYCHWNQNSKHWQTASITICYSDVEHTH